MPKTASANSAHHQAAPQTASILWHQRISDLAAHIATNYPEAAEQMHHLLDGRYNDTTIGSPARKEAALYSKQYDQYRGRVAELRDLIVQHMPDLAKRLDWIMRITGCWHNTPRFDWKPVIAELRAIQVEAVTALPLWDEFPFGDFGTQNRVRGYTEFPKPQIRATHELIAAFQKVLPQFDPQHPDWEAVKAVISKSHARTSQAWKDTSVIGLAELAGPVSSVKAGKQKTLPGHRERRDDMVLLGHIAAALKKNPGASIVKIAAEIGCNPSILYRQHTKFRSPVAQSIPR